MGYSYEIGKHIKGVNSRELAIQMVLKSKHPHAFVLSRISLTFLMLKSQSHLNTYYIAPQTESATFWVDYGSMVINKKFPYIKQFNDL